MQSLIHFYGIGFLIRIDTKSVKSLVLKKFVIISILQNIAFEKFKNMALGAKTEGSGESFREGVKTFFRGQNHYQ